MVTSSSSIRSASATSPGSPVRVISLPRTWMSASRAFSIRARCPSPGPSSATMLTLVGTTTVCSVPGFRERSGLSVIRALRGRPLGGVQVPTNATGVGVTGHVGCERSPSYAAGSGPGDQQDAQAHLVGRALSPEHVAVLSLGREGGEAVAKVLAVGAGHLDGVAAGEVDRTRRAAALVV